MRPSTPGSTNFAPRSAGDATDPDRLHRRWIMACAIGEMVGIGAVALVALLLQRTLAEPTTTGARWLKLVAMSAAGAAEGAALGYLQWRVLRRRLPRLRAGEWVAVTVALAVVGWLAGMVGPVFGRPGAPVAEPSRAVILVLAAGAGAAAGALFGAGQWLVLRHHASNAGRWVLVHVPGWAAALAAIFLGASLPERGWTAWATALAAMGGGLGGGVLLGAITGFVVRGLRPWVDERAWSLAGRVCVVTGATSGIGLEVAKGLARMGATVIMPCRVLRRGAPARAAVAAAAPGATPSLVDCDLASLASVRAAAEEISRRWGRLDVLVHAAGATFRERTSTADGIEGTLAVDVVGPHLLTRLLAPQLVSSAGRVITLAGISHRRGRLDLDDLSFDRRPYDWLAANAQAQLGRVLLTTELARRASGLTAVAVHPGAVLTSAQARLPAWIRLLIHTVLRPGFVRAELGALPALLLAASPAAAPSGRFVNRFTLSRTPQDGQAEALWQECERLTGGSTSGARPRRAHHG